MFKQYRIIIFASLCAVYFGVQAENSVERNNNQMEYVAKSTLEGAVIGLQVVAVGVCAYHIGAAAAQKCGIKLDATGIELKKNQAEFEKCDAYCRACMAEANKFTNDVRVILKRAKIADLVVACGYIGCYQARANEAVEEMKTISGRIAKNNETIVEKNKAVVVQQFKALACGLVAGRMTGAGCALVNLLFSYNYF